MGTVGTAGLGVVVVAGFFAVGLAVVGCFEGAAVLVAFGRAVDGVPGALVARWEGRTRAAVESLTSRDFAAVIALFSLAMTGSATVTTASAAAISAANHNFLNAPSGRCLTP
ncbi:MAG TPA: hypothetical protein VMS92_10355 [Mycobacterium sp.]|nr:hypothetical protein [Mycobacterium sp.]